MANLVSVENVSKSFGLKTLLDGVSLGVQTGDRIGVVGLNGGGKSTLLKVLTGREQPDEGRVSQMNDIRVAMVTQEANLNPEDTVADVVLKPWGWRRSSGRRKAACVTCWTAWESPNSGWIAK